MPIETRPYDSANYLDSEEMIAAYLDEAMETGDPAFVSHALGVIARVRGLSHAALDAGLPPESLAREPSGEEKPELATFLRVVRTLGLRLTATPLEGPIPAETLEE